MTAPDRPVAVSAGRYSVFDSSLIGKIGRAHV